MILELLFSFDAWYCFKSPRLGLQFTNSVSLVFVGEILKQFFIKITRQITSCQNIVFNFETLNQVCFYV